MNKKKITYDEFLELEKNLEISYGKILGAERIPKSDKLLKLTVSFGGEPTDTKIVVTNLGGLFEPERFKNLTLPFVVNLLPTKIMGVISECMIMVPKNGSIIELENYSLGSKLL